MSPPPRDSEDSTTEEDQNKDQLEQEKSKSTKENRKTIFVIRTIFQGA